MPLILMNRDSLSKRIKVLSVQPTPTESLKECYTRVLTETRWRKTIALPLATTSVFGLAAARKGISAYLEDHDKTVLLVLDKKQPTLDPLLEEELKIHLGIDDAFSISVQDSFSKAIRFSIDPSAEYEQEADMLSEAVKRKEESFSAMTMRIIREKDLDHVSVYKRANISRKLFSKIKNRPDYQPTKRTAIALGIALELNYDQMLDLLDKAGFSLSRSFTFDLIIEFFIKREDYDIFKINEALFSFDEELLGL